MSRMAKRAVFISSRTNNRLPPISPARLSASPARTPLPSPSAASWFESPPRPPKRPLLRGVVTWPPPSPSGWAPPFVPGRSRLGGVVRSSASGVFPPQRQPAPRGSPFGRVFQLPGMPPGTPILPYRVVRNCDRVPSTRLTHLATDWDNSPFRAAHERAKAKGWKTRTVTADMKF